MMLFLNCFRISVLQDMQSCYSRIISSTGGSEVKVSASNAGNPGSIPGSGRSPGEGNGNPLQYSCLENPMDRGAWRATVHGVSKSQTQLTVQLDYKESSDRLLSFCVPKSLRIGTAAVKLKNTCFLEETLCPTQAAY